MKASVTKYSSLQQLSYTLGFMGAISLSKGKANINRLNFSCHFNFILKIGHGSLKPGARSSKVPVTLRAQIKYSNRNIKNKSAGPG